MAGAAYHRPWLALSNWSRAEEGQLNPCTPAEHGDAVADQGEVGALQLRVGGDLVAADAGLLPVGEAVDSIAPLSLAPVIGLYPEIAEYIVMVSASVTRR